MSPADLAVEFAAVSFQYTKKPGALKVLQDIELTLQSGDMLCLLGPSGGGKTTMVNLIIGLAVPTAGTVRVFGETAPYPRSRYRVGYMPQDTALYEDLTALENLEFFGVLYGLKKKQARARGLELLELFSLADKAKVLVKHFSGGMKRRISLAIALLHNPDLLILDEPTVGLDPRQRLTIWQHFSDLQSQGKTLLITTHVMDEANRCDQVAMLGNHRILQKDSPAQIMAENHANSLEEAFLHLLESTDPGGGGDPKAPSEKGASAITPAPSGKE